jgi:hypothetical protein
MGAPARGSATLALGLIDVRAMLVRGRRALGTPGKVGEIGSDGALEDEAGTEPAQLGEAVGLVRARQQERLDISFDAGARGYPSIHGVCLLCGLQVRFGGYAVLTATLIGDAAASLTGDHPAPLGGDVIIHA